MGKKKLLPVTALDRGAAIKAWMVENKVQKKTKAKHAKFIAHFHKLNKSQTSEATEDKEKVVCIFVCAGGSSVCGVILARVRCVRDDGV
jgi:hypothetical protein